MLSNNSNELISRRQQGRSMLDVRGEVSKHVNVTASDPTDLGRWHYFDLVNRDNEVRLISVGQYVKYKSTLGTVCLQRRRYFLARKIEECPWKLFILYLTQFIEESICLGLEVILTVDANEYVVKGKIARKLKNLGLVEAFCTKINPEGGPASYFRGRHYVDGVWYTHKIVPTVVTIFPYHFSAGNNGAYVVEFQMDNILDKLSVPMCILNKRRLICSFPIIVQRYIKRAEAQF